MYVYATCVLTKYSTTYPAWESLLQRQWPVPVHSFYPSAQGASPGPAWRKQYRNGTDPHFPPPNNRVHSTEHLWSTCVDMETGLSAAYKITI